MVKLASFPENKTQINIDLLIKLVKNQQNVTTKQFEQAKELIRFCLFLPGGTALLQSLEGISLTEKANRIKQWMREDPEIQELHSLNLAGLGLKRIPEEIGFLKGLVSLSLNLNLLTELPESLGKLEKLRYLYLHHNKLPCLPISLKELHELRILTS